MKITLTAAVVAATLALSACSSDDDNTSTPAEAVSYQITFTNLSQGQLMTPPVVAIHDPSVHLFQVGETATDAVRDIAEMGNNAALVAFATAAENTSVVSDAGVAGAGPFASGGTVMTSLTTDQSDHVFSAVNMVICTNDGISGFDSISLPTDNEPLTLTAMAYDAGTRQNQNDSETFFPPPCRSGDVVEAPVNDPREAIVQHPGQSGLNVPVQDATPANSNWDFQAGEAVLQVEIVRN